MSYIHDHSASRAKVAEQRVADYVNTWPEELAGAFWSAVNAPTYGESAEKTLGFAAAFAHELAEKIRAEFADAYDAAQEVLSGSDAMAAADHIDPEVTL